MGWYFKFCCCKRKCINSNLFLISETCSKDNKSNPSRSNEVWSGEATRHRATEETQVDVTIGDDNASGSAKEVAKERPVWLLESTVINAETSQVCSDFTTLFINHDLGFKRNKNSLLRLKVPPVFLYRNYGLFSIGL